MEGEKEKNYEFKNDLLLQEKKVNSREVMDFEMCLYHHLNCYKIGKNKSNKRKVKLKIYLDPSSPSAPHIPLPKLGFNT